MARRLLDGAYSEAVAEAALGHRGRHQARERQIDPTERSIPAVRITKVMPIAISP